MSRLCKLPNCFQHLNRTIKNYGNSNCCFVDCSYRYQTLRSNKVVIMELFVKNIIPSLRFCLSVLKFVGFLKPVEPSDFFGKLFFNIYWFSWFMFLVGGIVIAQIGAIVEIWGDLTLMTSAAFLLFTNCALASKIINVVINRRAIREIITTSDDELTAEDRKKGIDIVKSCNKETTRSLCVYIWLSGVTVFGWAAGAEKNQLPLRAWYPYNTSKSPAYEVTYVNQSTALILSALVNVCLDTLVTSLIAVCCCRLRLVGLSLRTLCADLGPPEKMMLRKEDERKVQERIKHCVVRHEAALKTAAQIKNCFEIPIFAQFSVSIVIICVTAYQLALELNNKNWVRIISMVAYLLCMMLQVFLYCYQGNQLSEESSEIAGAAYCCPWYMCSVPLRRALLIVMIRTRNVTKLTAGGITTLSLTCFTSIIKASYTFFTVLKQVEDRNH